VTPSPARPLLPGQAADGRSGLVVLAVAAAGEGAAQQGRAHSRSGRQAQGMAHSGRCRGS
jgi:hypothetical protein